MRISTTLAYVIASLSVLATQLTASEFTASLAEKVRICDLVAIVEITSVEKGHFNTADSGQAEDNHLNVKLTANVTKRIKGSSPDTIAIYEHSIPATAGFWEYGIEPGKSYIAYLQVTANGTYRLGWSSNQFLEVISDDGRSVNDIGQTLDQVPLAPKLRKLRALAAGGLPLALITDPITLIIALPLLLLVSVLVVRKRRSIRASKPNEIRRAESGRR